MGTDRRLVLDLVVALAKEDRMYFLRWAHGLKKQGIKWPMELAKELNIVIKNGRN